MRPIFLLLTALSSFGCSDDNYDTMQESPITWTECSQNIESHPCNFTLKNQDNNDISLYDYYGQTIVLDFSAMWCGPCRMAASDVQVTADAYDVAYITILIENSSGDQPSPSDASNWAESYGIKEPVLTGSRDMLSSSGEDGWPLASWPTFYFINNEMILKGSLQGYSKEAVDYYLDQLAGQ